MDLEFRFNLGLYQVHGNGGHWALRRDGKLVEDGAIRVSGPDLTFEDLLRVEAELAIERHENRS